MKQNKTLLVLSVLAALCAASCTDEDSALGTNLADPTTRYNGRHTTLYADKAYSQRDDSLVTSNATYNVAGYFADDVFGKVNASIYTQIALPSDANGINLSAATIDSATLYLVKDALFPCDSDRTYTLHFEIMPLAEALQSDSTYYGYSTLPVREGEKYFDGTVTIGVNDTVVAFPLGGGIGDLLRQEATTSDFLANTKGLRIRVLEDYSDTCIVAFNFSATRTRLTAWYHVEGDTNEIAYHFVVGTGAKRFMHFDHDYTTADAGADSIGGSQRLYLEPFGGYNVMISFDSALRVFHTAHPRAAIHYAELLLPLADEAPDIHPDSLLAFTLAADGSSTLMPDQRYNMGGDGAYNADSNHYRLRVSLLVQSLLRQEADYGTRLMLYYSRRHPVARTVVNGTGTDNPVRIRLTYTE